MTGSFVYMLIIGRILEGLLINTATPTKSVSNGHKRVISYRVFSRVVSKSTGN